MTHQNCFDLSLSGGREAVAEANWSADRIKVRNMHATQALQFLSLQFGFPLKAQKTFPLKP